MKTKYALLVATLVSLAIPLQRAGAQFIKIDDFLNATNGNLATQVSDGPSNGVWHAVTSAAVVTITNSTTPNVGQPGSGTPVTTHAACTTDISDGAAYIALPVAVPTTSTVATFFMQFDMGPTKNPNNVNWDFAPSVGTDAGGGLNDIELNANETAGGGNRTGVTIRNGAVGFVEMSADGKTVFTPQNNTAYNIWFVVNNSTRTFIIYMQDADPGSTDLPNLTQMQIGTATGNTPTTFTTNAIGFRNTSPAAIGYFVFGTGGGSGFTTTQFVYSLYEDPNFLDLTNPVTGAAPVTVSPPVITAQPQPEEVFAGKTATFTVTATGGNLHYHWQTNGVALNDGGSIAGSGSNVLTITGVSAANVGNYSCLVSNVNPGAYESTNSAVASLTIVTPSGSFESALAADNPLHLYAFDDVGDPSTGTNAAFDYEGGDNGIYGINTQNGIDSIPGPRLVPDGLNGFSANNFAAEFFGFTQSSHVTVSTPWNLNTNTVTITAWINPNGPQENSAAIVFNRGGGSDVEGLNFSTSGNSTLGYTWNNDGGTTSWDSGIAPPQNQWSLVALVVTPTNATIDVMNTSGILSSTHNFAHVPAAFSGTTMIGDDSGTTTGARTFGGSIDEVAVFNQALSQVQLQGIFAAASSASFPATNSVALVTPEPIYPAQTVQFSSINGGSAPFTYRWLLNNVPLSDGANGIGTILGSTTPSLIISNLAAGDSGQTYNLTLVTSNASGAYTSANPATLVVSTTQPGQTITTVEFEPAGADWNTGASWSDGNPASVSAFSEPNSVYEIVPGTMERSPVSSNAVFPGNVLIIEGDGVLVDGGSANFATNTTTGELRLKEGGATPATNFGIAYTDGGTVTFPDLQLNGGQIDNGTSAKVTLNGQLDVLTNSTIYVDSAAAGAVRSYQINSFLTGTGTITYSYLSSVNFSNDLIISGVSNTFSGQWNILQGTLLGNSSNSLGTNTITVGTNAALETTYNINNPKGNLVLNGLMYLYTTDTFNGVTIDGTNLQAGTYTFAQLHAAYPANFPATWPVQIGSATGTNTGAGSIIVLSTLLPQITQQPTPAILSLYPGQTAQFTVGALGALSYQWWFTNLSGVGTKLNDGGQFSGTHSNVVTITGIGNGNAGSYSVVLSNAVGSIPSSNAVLTILTPGGPESITMSVVESVGQDWDTGTNWSDGNPVSLSAFSNPGSTYEVLSGALLRTPNVAANTAFPGVQLAIDSGAELLLEHIGARGIAFPDLQLNGGSLDNGADGVATLTGKLEIANSVSIFTDSNSPPGLIVNFDVPGGAGGTNYAGHGAFGDIATNTYWNPVVQTGGAGTSPGPATNSDGVTTSAITLTLNTGSYGEGNDYGRYGTDDNSAGSTANTPVALEGNYFYINNTFTPSFAQNTITNVLNNVPPGIYNLYLYGNNGGGAGGYQGLGAQNDWGTVFAVTTDLTPTETLSTSNRTASFSTDSFIQGADYVVFSNIDVGSGGSITFTYTPNTNVFSPDYAGANSAAAFNGLQLATVVPPNPGPRALEVDSVLSGSGAITYTAGDTNFMSDLSIGGSGNTFNGQWNVTQGTLLGRSAGSLGTNAITVGPGGALETAYNINDTGASLTLNGRLFLHQNDTFRTVSVNGLSLSPGTYSAAQLTTFRPANFPSTWPLQSGSTVSNSSGSLTVLSGPPPSAKAAKIAGLTIAGNNVTLSGNNGAPTGTYHVLSSTNLASPFTSWTTVTNGSYDGGGNFRITAPFTPTDKSRFYVIVSP